MKATKNKTLKELGNLHATNDPKKVTKRQVQYIVKFILARGYRMGKNEFNGGWEAIKKSKTFKRQCWFAWRLCRKYGAESVYGALKSKQGEKLYSLAYPGLPELIEGVNGQ